MIMLGSMNLTRTVEQTMFACPQCRGKQPGRIRSRRPWLTLYFFIPICPVGPAEQFVQCSTCKSTWDMSVLAPPSTSTTEVAEEQFREDALRATILITTADGTITEEEIQAIMSVADHLLNRPIDREQLGALCSSAQRLNIAPENYIRSVHSTWTTEQRTKVIQAAFLAASAGGELNPAQLDMLGRLKDLFQFTDEEYADAIEHALQLSDESL